MRALQGFDFFGKEMVRTMDVLEDSRASLLNVHGYQKIQYAKGKSDTVAKLDGTYKMPATAGSEVTSTALQQSVFGAPPSSLPALVEAPVSSAETPGVKASGEMDVDSREDGPKGVKRSREEESDHEEAPMDEDSDAPMDASSDEDE